MLTAARARDIAVGSGALLLLAALAVGALVLVTALLWIVWKPVALLAGSLLCLLVLTAALAQIRGEG